MDPNLFEMMPFRGVGRGRARGALQGTEREILTAMNMDNDWITPSEEDIQRRPANQRRGRGARGFARGIVRTQMGIIPPNSTPASNALLGQIAAKGDNRPLNYNQMLALIRDQPVGSRTICDITGWTMGLIAYIASNNNIPLHGYYLSGTVVLMQNEAYGGDVIDDQGNTGGVQVRANVERRQIAEFPLWRVEIPDQANTIDEGEMMNMGLIHYLDRVKMQEGGSNVGFFILWENCTIKRRQNFPQYMDRKTHTCITGGFPQLLPDAHRQDFEYFWSNRPVSTTTGENEMIRSSALATAVANFSPPNLLKCAVYIPSGQMNCVQDCIIHCYINRFNVPWAVGKIPDYLAQQEKDKQYIISILDKFKDEWINKQIRLREYNSGNMANTSLEKKKLKACRRYNKMVSTGYSNRFLRYLMEFFWEYDIWLHMFYLYYEKTRKTLKSDGYRLRERGEDIAMDLMRKRRPYVNPVDGKTHIYLFQMRIGGEIYSNDKAVHVVDPRVVGTKSNSEKDEDKLLIGYMHMIGIYTDPKSNAYLDSSAVILERQFSIPNNDYEGYIKNAHYQNQLLLRKMLCPTIPAAINRLELTLNTMFTWQHGVDFIRHVSETILQRYMSAVLAKNRYDPKINTIRIKELVDYQLQRQHENKIPTLIFNDPNRMHDFANNPKLTPDVKLKQHNAMVKTGRSGVVVYDLESVTLTKDVMHMIDEKYLRNCAKPEEMIDGVYGPVETEIPFTAQWAPVNVSMEGRMYQRANDLRCRVERYDVPEHLQTTPIEPESTIMVGDILLQDVETCYGNDRLGDCITEMLMNMAQWAHANAIRVLYAYAHNGSGFDALLVLRYCTFEIVNMLKTARGVIVLDYKIPIDSNNHVTIRLRDTKLWMSGSLHRIASALKCPKSWQKLDFPITMLTAHNCYHPAMKALSKDYGENDIRALAWIVKKLNWVVGESSWDPASPYSVKPALGQFVTVMSMVKAGMYNHFVRNKITNMPTAVDIPSLRNWLKKATIGGRVEAYARSYFSPYVKDIIDAWHNKDTETLKTIHNRMTNEDSYDVVLDVTSLYPTAQSLCPMPTGQLYSIDSIAQCNSIINSIQCDECEKSKKLCLQHRNDTTASNINIVRRPFAIILVKNIHYVSEPNKIQRELFPFCARKLDKDQGLVYSFESTEEIQSRYIKHTKAATNDPTSHQAIKDIQAFTNIDLYWMRKMGFSFEIVGGFGWETGDIYCSFLLDAFEKRKQAKMEGNSVMSELWKLKVNGSYGVTTQTDIEESSMLITLPDELKDLNPIDGRVTTWVKANRDCIGPTEFIKDGQLLPSGVTLFTKSKAPGVSDYFMALSPMQIGAAVLSWARHIVNLIMFADDVVFPVKYTDTDSIDIPGRCVRQLEENYPGVIDNRSCAELGTLKNDHQEGCGEGSIIFASLLMTKKVKGHFVINKEGKVSICTTFKGLNPQMIDSVTGRRFHGDRYEYLICRALLDIHFNGVPRDVPVTTWKRSLERGIEITDHPQSGYGATYLDRSLGVTFLPSRTPSVANDLVYSLWGDHIRKNGLTEMFVPYGSNYPVEYHFVNLSANPAHKDMRIAKNIERLQHIEDITGLNSNHWYNFIDAFYEHRDEFAFGNNPEYVRICHAIETIDEEIHFGGGEPINLLVPSIH